MAPRRSPADARKLLLDAALRVFARHGYEGASVRDIAVEAGVAAGLLYHYFPSKEALLLALFERSASLVFEAFAAAASEPDPCLRLRLLLEASARITRENEDFFRISYGVRYQHAVVAGLGAGIAAQSAAWVGLFSVLLGELGSPEPAIDAQILFATLDGVFQHYVLDPAHFPLDAVLDRVVLTYGGAPRSPS